MTHLSDFQALLFDVDRTLVKADYDFPEGVVELLKKLHQTGYVVGMCTGRAYTSVKNSVLPVFEEINPEAYHIVSGGAHIINSQGKVFEEKIIPTELVHYLIQNIQTDGKFLASAFQNLFLSQSHLIDYESVPNINLKSLKDYQNEPVTLIIIHEVYSTHPVLEKLKDKLEIKDMENNEGIDYVEITAKNVNKGTALQKWAELSQVSVDKTIGFGDSANDLEFIQEVGFGVAMGNAVDELKQKADRVIGDVNEDGLRIYLEDLLAGKEL